MNALVVVNLEDTMLSGILCGTAGDHVFIRTSVACIRTTPKTPSNLSIPRWLLTIRCDFFSDSASSREGYRGGRAWQMRDVGWRMSRPYNEGGTGTSGSMRFLNEVFDEITERYFSIQMSYFAMWGPDK